MHGPSHGGGSSFGGGGSGGGFGGASFGATGGGNRAPRTFFFFGHTYIVSNGFMSAVMFILIATFLAIFFLVSCSMDLSNNTNYQKNFEEDALEWQQLIVSAQTGAEGYGIYTLNNIHFEADSGYFMNDPDWYYLGYYSYNPQTGDRVAANKMCTYDGVIYYQIYFNFTNNDGDTVMGCTYGQYKETKILNMNSKSIDIAYGMIDGEPWAINADYDLEECADYLLCKQECNNSKVAVTISAIVSAVLIAALALTIVYGLKRARKADDLKEAKTRAEIEKTKAETDLVKEEAKQKNRVCAYCGGIIPDDADSCPGCGARQVADKEK